MISRIAALNPKLKRLLLEPNENTKFQFRHAWKG
jgi:hypothetical protein